MNDSAPQSSKQNTQDSEKAGQNTPAATQAGDVPQPATHPKHKTEDGSAVRKLGEVTANGGPEPEKQTPPSAPIHERKTPEEASHLATVRTFEDDSRRAVQEKKASMADIAIAEQKKRQEEGEAPKKSNSFSGGQVFLIILSIALLLGGAGAFGYILYFQDNEETGPTDIDPPALIHTESEIEVSTENQTDIAVVDTLSSMRTRNLTLNTFINVYLTKVVTNDEDEEQKELITVDEFFNIFDSEAPASLVRTLDDRFMFGFHGFDKNQPFFIFQITSYRNAFSGMLRWEKDIEQDLLPLLGPRSELIPKEPPTSETATTTEGVATSTEETDPENIGSENTVGDTIERPFSDRVIQNRDVRVMELENGATRLIYTLTADNMLIITTNEETLKEIFSRMGRRRFTQ